MADEEADLDYGNQDSSPATIEELSQRLKKLANSLKDSNEPTQQLSSEYCQSFCETLVEYVSRRRADRDQRPLVDVYRVALLSFAQSCSLLSSHCENVPLVLERLSLSCVELLLSLNEPIPDAVWERFKSSVQTAQALLQQAGLCQLHRLSALARGSGIWTNTTLQSILSHQAPQVEKVNELFALEGPVLLEMRIKHLMKENHYEQAASLAKACAENLGSEGKGSFRQTYLVCLCTFAAQDPLMEELLKVDCRDALEMICNLEADGDEKGAFTLCSAFLSRQLLQEDTYCAWELTLFWSKLLKRLESSEQSYLERCRQMSCLSKTVFHILFFIKVIQSEIGEDGLPACIEMCIRAFQMDSCDGNSKATICKTISCLLPTDLEVKRACQLTEFLLEPTVDSYYAVEAIYNEPDQKLEEENLPVPNSLRCEILLVFKTQWPFDPEFWDWKTLKHHCLALMGEEASIVSSIDELNDGENLEEPERGDTSIVQEPFKDVSERFLDATNELNEITDERQKKREIKKLREKGFVSARFRNWQAYMQYCLLCDKEFLGHRIVRHAQTHFKDGQYSCPICAENFSTKETLEPHVASHVKLSCKERLAAMKTIKKLANSKAAAPVIAQLKAKASENQVGKSKTKGRVNGHTLEGHSEDMVDCSTPEVSAVLAENTEENICPVPNCRKRFKYFRNLLAHVKDHGDNEEAERFLEMQSKKVVCQYCRRQFVNVDHLNDHLQVHCGARPYICIQLNCKASFLSNAELLVHTKEHPIFKAKCMFTGCGKIFHEAYKLYDHEAQHYKTFTCKVPGCGKVFHTQGQLDLHEEGHFVKENGNQTTEGQNAESEETPPQTNMLNPTSETEVIEQSQVPVRVKHSIENMLNNTAPGCTREFQPRTVETELPGQTIVPLQHTPCADGSAIQSTFSSPMSQQNQPRLEESLIEQLLSGDGPPIPMASASSYQTEDALSVPPADVLHGQIQTAISNSHFQSLYQDSSAESSHYNPNSRKQQPAQYHDGFPNNMPPTTHASHGTVPFPPASQVLPPHVAPRPANGQGAEIRSMLSMCTKTPTQLEGEKERYKCAFETCTRDYSSYRSVTKHMKACHPDFYVQWKLARRNSKLPKATINCMSANGNLNSAATPQNSLVNLPPTPVVQMQKAIGPPLPHPIASNPNQFPHSSHPSTCTSQTLPSQVEDIFNPILLSQLGDCANQSAMIQQSQMGLDRSWIPTPRNNSVIHQQLSHSQTIPQNMGSLPHEPFSSHMTTPIPGQKTEGQHMAVGQTLLHPEGALTSHIIPPHENSTQGLHGSTSNNGLHSISVQNYPSIANQCVMTQKDVTKIATGSLNPPQQIRGPVDSRPHPVLSSYVDKLNVPIPPNCPKVSLAPSYIQQEQNVSFPNFSPSERVLKSDPELKGGLPLQSISTPQAKINSGSQSDTGCLGNDDEVKPPKRHKRTKWPAIKKDGKFICSRCFREFQSPKSLGGHLSKRSHCKEFEEADLTADLPESFLDLLNSPHLMNTPQPTPSSHMQPLTKGPLDPNLYPNVTFPQANGSSYNNEGEPGGDFFKQLMENPGNPNLSTGVQQAFHNSSGPYTTDGRGLENSVIQHTANVVIKSEHEHHRDYTTCDPHFNDSDLSDPFLSELLSENHSLASLNNSPTNHINYILCPETQAKMKEFKGHLKNTNPSGLSNDGLLTTISSLVQNPMKNPVSQVTSPQNQRFSMTNNLPVNIQSSKDEENVKKRLREQILSGDFHRRGSWTQTSSVDSNSCLRPTVTRGLRTNVPQHAEAHTSKENDVATLRHVTNSVVDSSQTEATTPNDDSVEPSVTSSSTSNWINANNQAATPPISDEDKVMEIRTALERLNLDREVSEDVKAIETSTSTEFTCDAKQMPEVESMTSNTERTGCVKPFTCDGDGCSYRAMTKDALFKHLTKQHNYTDDMLFQIKKDQMKFAPFQCHMCSKTFTRNSNLRVHYQTAHNLLQNDILKQRLTNVYSRKVEDGHKESPFPIPSASTMHNMADNPGDYGLSNVMKLQTDINCAPHRIPVEGCRKAESSSQPDMQHSAIRQTTVHLAHNNTSGILPPQALACPQAEVSGQPLETVPRNDHQPSEHLQGIPTGGPLHTGTTPVTPMVAAQPQALQTGSVSPDKKLKASKPRVGRPRSDGAKMEATKKAKEKKPDADDVFSPYRPYRCVHQGCVAAFTIQHNLILHYRAVHQSALPTFEVNSEAEGNLEEADEDQEDEKEDLEEQEGEIMAVTEFRCQVQDCSRIFQEATGLLQHYLQLHKFTIDKAGALMSNINLGRFQCDQPGCTAFFTAFWKYIGHIDSEHKDAKPSKVEPVEGMFRCDVEGCDCAYTTRSNLLRHTMKKHRDIYKLQLMNQKKGEERVRPTHKKSSNGKENIENNKRIIQKERLKDERNNHWTKYGKPSLKSKEEAAAMCTKKFLLQYPCMIKGCESVLSSERNIMKHYVGHGLSEKYLEEQRSHFIFCKKIPRSRFRRIIRSDDSEKSEESTFDTSDNEDTVDTGLSESEYSKPPSGKETTEDTELSDDKITDRSSEVSDASVAVKRKRGRPRKEDSKRARSIACRRITRLRAARSRYTANYADINSDSTSSSTATTQDDLADQSPPINSFKPMGFEVSFLQFLEDSQTVPSDLKRKAAEDMPDSFLPRGASAFHLRSATVVCKRSDVEAYSSVILKHVEFRNPQKLTSLNNVTFAVHDGFSNVTDLLMKQLHELRPTVVLEKELYLS